MRWLSQTQLPAPPFHFGWDRALIVTPTNNNRLFRLPRITPPFESTHRIESATHTF
jgi:hypothetical protein